MTEYVLDGRYQLDYRIASGGMGEVWAGTDLRLNRAVAVKMLSAQHSGDEQFRARFRAEARYAASLLPFVGSASRSEPQFGKFKPANAFGLVCSPGNAPQP